MFICRGRAAKSKKVILTNNTITKEGGGKKNEGMSNRKQRMHSGADLPQPPAAEGYNPPGGKTMPSAITNGRSCACLSPRSPLSLASVTANGGLIFLSYVFGFLPVRLV